MSRRDVSKHPTTAVAKPRCLQPRSSLSAKSSSSQKRILNDDELPKMDPVREARFAKQLQLLKKHREMVLDFDEFDWKPQTRQGRRNDDMDTTFSMDEELERLASTTHEQALKDIDDQIRTLKTRIYANKELLDLTLRGIETLSFSDDRQMANALKNKSTGYGLNVDDIFNGTDAKQWDKRLEEVSKEIEKVKNQLKSDSFEENVSTGIHKFHQVLTDTLDTIGKMSGKDGRSERTPVESMQDTLVEEDLIDAKFYEVKARLEALDWHQTPERDTPNFDPEKLKN